jgi:hypothetical protein
MGVLIPVGYGLAAIHWRCAGATADSISTFGYNPDTLDPSEHANELYDALWAGTGDARPCSAASMSTEWSFLGVSVTEMDESGPLIGEFFSTVVGTATAAPVPINSAVLIRKNTASGGRKNRGRMFVPPIRPIESGVDALGNIDSDQVTAIQSRWDLFFSGLADDGPGPMVVLHSSAGTPTVVTSLAVQGTLATQRRRMR